MAGTTFFRLLKTPIDAKGDALAARIAALNAAGQAEETFTLDPADFAQIPGSPFAYWVSDELRRRFADSPTLQTYGFGVQHGLSTKNDFRWLRLAWEVAASAIDASWCPFAKGGAFARYYLDLHLLVNAENDFAALEAELLEKYPYLGDNAGWVLHPENDYLSPGLTYTRRTTSPFSVRAFPSGAYFSDKGPVCVGEESALPYLLALLNSSIFRYYLELQMGAADAAARSYEVGIVSGIPLPRADPQIALLGSRATQAHDLARRNSVADETTHAFGLPALVQHRDGPLLEASLVLDAEVRAVQARLAAIQAEIDDLVFDLYGLGEADRALVCAEIGVSHRDTEDTEESRENLGDLSASVAEEPDDKDEEEEAASPQDAVRRTQDLLMWCVGVAFGRWDVRMALDPTLLPALQGPFDPLPRCAPGALIGANGLPPTGPEEIAPEEWLRTRKNVLDLPLPIQNPRSQIQNPPVAWAGILVDDPTHPADIVGRVREVLALLWGERADAVEREACNILGVKSLRDYFRDPRGGFFAFHIKRYSKSRRKAPIYWLLQSEKRNYALWLYVHRLTPMTLYAAGRDYADAKVALEQARLEELRQGVEALSGSARKHREGEIEHQRKLVAEVADFRKRLDAVALINLPPDLNDGVVISIAPLRELVPWKEAERAWRALLAGEYPWSTMAKRMRERAIVERKA
jgi:hypothetical protein